MNTPKNKVKRTGKKRNFNNTLGLFLLILIRIKLIKVIELKENKINKYAKFDIF